MKEKGMGRRWKCKDERRNTILFLLRDMLWLVLTYTIILNWIASLFYYFASKNASEHKKIV